MGYVILEVKGYSAKDLEGWHWSELLGEPDESIKVNGFDSERELETAVCRKHGVEPMPEGS